MARNTFVSEQIDVGAAPSIVEHVSMRSSSPAPRRTLNRENSTAIERAGLAPDPARSSPIVALPLRHERADRQLLVLLHHRHDAGLTRDLESGIADIASTQGYALASMTVGEVEQSDALTGLLADLRPNGVILSPSLADRSEIAGVCQASGVRCFRIGRKGDLDPRERGAAAASVQWLVSIGHSRIGFIAGPDHSPSARERELGYLDAMAEHGLDRGPALIVQGDNSFEGGIEAAKVLLEISPRPTVILAATDEMAAGALHAATEAGIDVPRDLGVVGLDDTALARMTLPPLTCLHIPWQAAAACAARSIIDGAPVQLPPDAVVSIADRGSVAALAR